MKKILCLLLAALMLFAITGCSANNNGDNKKEFELARGSWDADKKVFTNESTGIKITLSDSFTAYSDSKIAETYLDDPDYDLSNIDVKTALQIPDCGFSDTIRGNNCSLLYENVAAEGSPDIGEEEYLNIALTALNLETDGVYDLTLSGNTYKACDINNESLGITYKQTLACRNIHGYMALIAFTAFDKDGISEMINCFN